MKGLTLKKKKKYVYIYIYIYIYIYTEKVTLIFSFFSPTFLAFKAVRLSLSLIIIPFFSFIRRNRNGIENEQMIRWLEYERFKDETSFLQVIKSHRIYLMQDLTSLLTCFNSED